MHSTGTEEEDGHIASINIIPLVDVVLVLLIIFMVTTAFAQDSALKLDLPKGSRKTQVSQSPMEITVSVDPKGAIFINGKPSTLDDLQTQIAGYKNMQRKTMLVLRGDKSVLYGTLMPVLDEISRSGVELTLALTPGSKE